MWLQRCFKDSSMNEPKIGVHLTNNRTSVSLPGVYVISRFVMHFKSISAKKKTWSNISTRKTLSSEYAFPTTNLRKTSSWWNSASKVSNYTSCRRHVFSYTTKYTSIHWTVRAVSKNRKQLQFGYFHFRSGLVSMTCNRTQTFSDEAIANNPKVNPWPS